MTTYRLAVIGGTGPQGKGLGYRFARHGHEVVLGSRSEEGPSRSPRRSVAGWLRAGAGRLRGDQRRRV